MAVADVSTITVVRKPPPSNRLDHVTVGDREVMVEAEREGALVVDPRLRVRVAPAATRATQADATTKAKLAGQRLIALPRKLD